ncbi:MAG: CPBP family intramembrane glutamic endopeptidase [Chlamydiales bacterium]
MSSVNVIHDLSLTPSSHFPSGDGGIGKLAERAISYANDYLLIGLIEAVKIVTAGLFLNYLTKEILNTKDGVAVSMIIIAPIFEEIIFRGMIQKGIALCQKTWHHFRGKSEIKDEDVKAQQQFRIQISALLFASLHLFLPHQNNLIKFLQFGWTYLLGVTYGYLSEKYSTLSISMVAHGLNNALLFSSFSETGKTLKLLAIAINELFFIIIA